MPGQSAGPATPEQGSAVRALRLERRGKIGDGAVVLASAEVGIGAVVIDVGILGIEADRLAIIRDRRLVLAPGGVRDAPIVEGDREIRVELDSFGIICN